MKKMKKVLAMILSLAMVLAMSATAFADTVKTDGIDGSKKDKVTVKITNLSGGETVTLYQIAKGDYQGDGEHAFKGYTWATGISEEIQKKAEKATATTNLSSSDITSIVNGIIAENPTITPLNLKEESTDLEDGYVTKCENNSTVYEKEVPVGAYIAVITGATDGSVYNPIYLTATYNEAGALVGGEIDAKSAYGTEAVAKKTEPKIEKTITDGATPDTSEGENKSKDTASVGDVLTYTVKPTVPSYPKNANNKTLFVADKMSEGLTYNSSSLAIYVGTDKTKAEFENGTFKYDGKDIATVKDNVVKGENGEEDKIVGFYLNFEYENILVNADNDRTPYALEVVYTATVNEKAVVGKDGNDNTVKMYYANDPTTGSTFKPSDDKPEPDEGDGITKKETTKTVYTYKIAFRKIDEATNKPLAGAIFGIYKDKGCKELVDVVTTNAVGDDNKDGGYALSKQVEAGTYYVKEIAAPTGYSLIDTVHEVQAVWTSVTTINETETTIAKYTTEINEAINSTIVGYLKDGVLYKDQIEGSKPAYIKSTSTTTTQTSDFKENSGAGAGVNLFDKAIKNTKMSTLPSTGGIGTTIFTIGGCIIMICAAGLFFASRRKKAEN